MNPKERFITALTEALNHYNETAADEFGFDIRDEMIGVDMIGVEFCDVTGAPSGTLIADLSTITVTEEN